MADKILLGRTKSGLPVNYPGQGHPLTIARPRTGKSRCVALPELLTLNGSMFVLDKGGELTKSSAHWRRTVKGNDVYLIDPMRVVEEQYVPRNDQGELSYGYVDPIDYVRTSKSPLSAAFRIAEAAIPPGNHQDAHWATGGQLRMVATILWVACDPFLDDPVSKEIGWFRNMPTVWKMLSRPEDEKQSLELMIHSEESLVADQARTFFKGSKQNTELQSIRNQIRVHCTKTFSEPAFMAAMSKTNINFSEMGKRPITVYCVLPGDVAQTHRAFSRILISIVLSQLEAAGLRQFDATQRPTTFLLDEFAALGQFPLITDGLARLGGFGATFHLFLQNLGQLKETYGDAGMSTILGNVDPIQLFGGGNDPVSNKALSDLLGIKTDIKDGRSRSTKPGEGGSESQSTYGRLLYTPDEIGRLQMPTQIIKMAGQNPFECEVFEPTLTKDFPHYVAFMKAIQEGLEPEYAAEFCKQYQPRPQAVRQVEEPVVQQPVRMPQPSLLKRLDRGFASLLGMESD